MLDVRDAARVRAAAPRRQHQHRSRRPVRHLGGHVLDRERPIVIIASPGREAEAALRLGRIGFDNVAGYLEDGMQALKDRDDLLAATPQTSAAAVDEWLGAPDAPYLLDVRTPGEWQQQHIDGSVNIPLNRLAASLTEVPRNRPVVVFCAGRLSIVDCRAACCSARDSRAWPK